MSNVTSRAKASAPELTRPDPRRWRALAVLGRIQFMLVLGGIPRKGEPRAGE